MDNTLTTICCKNGIRKEFQVLEMDVFKWVLSEKKKHKKIPTKKLIQTYAFELYKKAGYKDFKASLGWYRRWKKRYNLKNYSSINEHSALSLRDLENSAATKNVSSIISYSDRDNSSSKFGNDANECSSSAANSNSLFCSQTLENFSLETDKLISNIEMINSPSEFFDFSSFDKSLESVDFFDVSTKTTENDNSCIKNFMQELIDDFGKYFSETDKYQNKKKTNAVTLSKKSCKYDNDFKDKIIQYISKHRIIEAATKFKVHPNTISNWIKESRFQSCINENFFDETKSKISINEIQSKEKEFIEWLTENDDKNIIISKYEVQEKIKSLCTSEYLSLNSSWFIKYCHRYINGSISNKTTKIRYSDKFRKLMINYASKTSQLKTASVFNIPRKQLFNWVKNNKIKVSADKKEANEKLLYWYESENLKPSGNTVRNTAKKIFNDCGIDINCSYSWYYKWCAKHSIPVKRNCDEEVIAWILSAYDQNLYISHHDVQKKASEIYLKNNEGNFKASSGWLLRFCKRYMNLIRRIPPLIVELPPKCEKNISNFLQIISDILIKYDIKKDSFGIMDEILLKIKPSGIIKGEVEKKPLLRNCGTNNIQGSVILSCLSNGIILPPVLILKDKNICNTTRDYFVLYQSNGVVDVNVILFWLKNIWFRHVQQPNLLLLDYFSPHNSHDVKKKCIENNSYLEIIPSGCSSKLNPLMQVVTPQFQENIDKNCTEWFENNSYAWQIGDNSPSLSSEDIIDWVDKAYKKINTVTIQELVRNIFKKMKLV